MQIFHERLKDTRKKSTILQKDVAATLRLPLRTYQSYEYGEAEPSLQTLVNIARLFEVSIDYLVGLTDKKFADYSRHS